MATPTLNERLRDAAIDHAIDLSRYTNWQLRVIIAVLNRSDAELSARLAAALADVEPGGQASMDRLDALLRSVDAVNALAFQQLSFALGYALEQTVGMEVAYQRELFASVVPPQVIASVGVAEVSASQAYAAAVARPFQGRLLREWAAELEVQRLRRVREAVRQGYIQQEPMQEIVRRVRGTRAEQYQDGILDITRRHATAVVRTAVQHTAAVARRHFYEANTDLIKAEQWLATLDTRTSEPCRLRDGKHWSCPEHKPIGGHKLPWGAGPGAFHMQCRSTSTPVLKSWQELGVNADDFTPSQRESMDGAVPAELSYGDWLRRQSPARQEEVLGVTRAKLMRAGLRIEQFADERGRWLTLEQLRARHAHIFARLEP